MPAWAEDAYPLTRLQAGMLFHGDFDAAQSLYQDLFLFRLRLPVDIPALEQALAETIAVHPALRTGFDLESFSRPLQLVHREVPSPLTVSDLRGLPRRSRKSNWRPMSPRNAGSATTGARPRAAGSRSTASPTTWSISAWASTTPCSTAGASRPSWRNGCSATCTAWAAA